MEYIIAALMLHKLGKPIDEESMTKVIEAAGGKVDEARLKTVVASLKGVDIDKVLREATLPVSTPAAPAAKKPEEKEEKKEEAVEGLAALFG